MKKLIIGILLGFLLNSAARTYWNYSWWKAEGKLTNEQMNKSYEKHGYYKIVIDTMGSAKYLQYPLITMSYSFRKWEVQYP